MTRNTTRTVQFLERDCAYQSFRGQEGPGTVGPFLIFTENANKIEAIGHSWL